MEQSRIIDTTETYQPSLHQTYSGDSGIISRPASSARLDRGLLFNMPTALCRHFVKPSSFIGHSETGLGVGTSARPRSMYSSRHNPDLVINTEHINQLSRFYAQRLLVLNFVRFDQALYFFGKKLFMKNFLVKTLFVTQKFKYLVYLGASFMKSFLLHMIILVWLHSFSVYYPTICTLLT